MSKENENKQAREQSLGEPDAEVKDIPVDENLATEEAVEGELIPEEAGAQSEIEQLQKELQEQKAAAEEHYNRLLRLQADFDNYRRRTAKEREDFARYASATLCESMLPVLDNFQLALGAKGQDPAKVVEGVEMIYRQLLDVLQKEGLTPVEARGQQFDPTKHEAAMQESTDQYPDNTVISELRRGYYLKDKLLRPAMVTVAKAE
ncbi:MAG: nucleotide exchange factor GrpE [Desulfotomaculaceae bacterium]